MTAAGGLEAEYRRLLRWYPPSYRGRHEDEILGVLMAAAQPGQRRPGARDSLDLRWSALQIRIRMILRGAGSQPWVALLAMLAGSPVSRRALFLLAIPFALGAVVYLCSLISPPPPASAGNALAVSPLALFLLAAMVYWLGHGPRAGQDVPGRPAAPGGA
jgi:hypothetical protein